VVRDGSLVDGYGGVGHQVHDSAGWQERQLLEAPLHEDFGNGLFDVVFESFGSLGVHIRHQSDFVVLSVFN
jgi:hypothetical protein